MNTGNLSELKRPVFSGGRQRFGFLIGLWVVSGGGSLAIADEPKPSQNEAVKQVDSTDVSNADRLFTLEVLPVLKEKCFGCHGNDPDDIRGDYNMLDRDNLIRGGESEEAALIPGSPEDSPVYQAVIWDGLEMPPKENDRLTEEQTAKVKEWIAQEAPWPDEETQNQIRVAERAVRHNAKGSIVDTSGGLSDDWTYRRYDPKDIWAFQPIDAPELASDTHPVDSLIDAKLTEKQLPAGDPADPRALIRRATYDLTGLPPSLADIDQFVTAWEKNAGKAWENLIDRLLASDHYGERQAQHWLDIVRYADTGGFSNDYERSNAWRYRDYVIRAFNQDKPFNNFILEQIAGDELRPGDSEALIATGMLRMGPWGTAMIPQKESRQIYLDDLVHNVGQAFLAMPMRCCKCHDHKFDPVPTRDYYRMYASFAGTQPAEMDAEFLDIENRNGFSEKKALVQELFDFATAEFKQVMDKQEAAAKKWYEEHDLPYKDEKARQKDPVDKKPPRHIGLDPEEKGIMKVRRQDVWIWERRLERFKPMAQAVYNGPDSWKNAKKLRKPKKLNEDWRPKNYIFGGGSMESELAPVKPGVLSATGLTADGKRFVSVESQTENQPDTHDAWQTTEELQGRRLALARWIANDDNPLTARTIVNRIWQSHFGSGIVRTANNFGAKGSKPSHPELLDWLTQDFIDHGWQIKRMHRLIMTSKAYQRASHGGNMEKQLIVDPDNRLLATFPSRRLTAEEVRDSLLKITGELNPEMGGLPIMPEINQEVALQPRMIQFSIAPAHQPSRTPEERNRRTIYAYRVRGQADPFLEIMNQPNPNESCELRDSASVTPQAFTLMNSDVMTDRSIAFALRIQDELPDAPDQWVNRAIELAFSREPQQSEIDSLRNYLNEMKAYHRKNEPEKREYPTEVVRSLVEEFTGEPFEFVEKLNVYEDYVPDAKPWTVEADTRALADVCLLLFNSNEFLYLY